MYLTGYLMCGKVHCSWTLLIDVASHFGFTLGITLGSGQAKPTCIDTSDWSWLLLIMHLVGTVEEMF